MSGKSATAVLAAALMFASAAEAGQAAQAQIVAATGSVLTVGVAGAAPAKAGSSLAAGDRVVVKTGSASLRYVDGCTVDLKANSMVAIAAKSPCAAGNGLVSVTAAQPAQIGNVFKGITSGGVLAGVGTVVILGAVVDGVLNADSRCNTYINDQCDEPISP